MKSRSVVIAAVASIVVSAGQVIAADDAPLMDAPEVTISTSSAPQGWYVRGEIGYAPWISEGSPDYRIYDAGGALASSGEFDSARFSKPFSAGLGIGYQFTDVFRADLTTDFFKGDFNGTARSTSPCSASAPTGTGCAYGQGADFRAYGVMANGYVDLATVAGFTPYVGVGAGATNLRWDTVTSRPACVDGTSACSGAGFAAERFDGDSSWRFTYALMAGVSYNVTEQVKLDLGYRYSDVAGGDMFGSVADGFKGRDGGLSRHEIRAGIRISFW